jgi:hypothetical protein
MNIANTSGKSVEVSVGPSGSGGGSDGWQSLGPGATLFIDLPTNLWWQVESRLAGTQLSSILQAQSNADVELVLSGSRIRPQLARRQPIEV